MFLSVFSLLLLAFVLRTFLHPSKQQQTNKQQNTTARNHKLSLCWELLVIMKTARRRQVYKKGGYNNLLNNSNNNKKAGGGWECGTFQMLTAREGEKSWGIWAYMLGPLPWVCHSSKLCQPSLSRARHVCSGIMGKRGSRWTKHGWGCEGHWGFSGPCRRGSFFFFSFFFTCCCRIFTPVSNENYGVIIWRGFVSICRMC